MRESERARERESERGSERERERERETEGGREGERDDERGERRESDIRKACTISLLRDGGDSDVERALPHTPISLPPPPSRCGRVSVRVGGKSDVERARQRSDETEGR